MQEVVKSPKYANVIHAATYPTAQLTYLNRTLPFQHHENQRYQYLYIKSAVIPIALTIQRCDTGQSDIFSVIGLTA